MSKNVSNRRVIVVGAGAAGLMAAGQAARVGAKTFLLEKKERPGRKLRITGKGRCNLTNIAPLADFLTHYGKNGKFLRQAFNLFFNDDLMAFLGGIGVDVRSERGGRVFPEGEDAVQVTESLIDWVLESGAKIKTRTSVDRLIMDDNRIAGVYASGREFKADAVIIATGGLSYPATGSTGDGYRLAKSVGHKIIPTHPALVPLKTSGNIAKRLQGLSLRNVTSRLFIDGKKKDEKFGEMLFTHYGLSGPIILTQSRQIVVALKAGQKAVIALDLKPALDENKLEARLLRDFAAHGKMKFTSILKGLLPPKLIPVCAELTGIDPEKPAHQINSTERRRLRRWLKDFRLEISGHRAYSEAIVTAGGVELKEINPRNMASKLMPGLYFAGEIINIDGETGGYNLQAAFSTGWLAGRSAAGR